MTYPSSPPPGPRKLERSRDNRVVGGVCAGVADYVNMDPTLVRVLTVVISLFTGVPIILYLIALFVLPEAEPGQGSQDYPPVGGSWSYDTYPQYPHQAGQPGGEPPTYAPSPSPQAAPYQRQQPYASPTPDPVWGSQGAPWEQPQPGASEQASSWESAPADPDGTPGPSGPPRS